MGLKHLQVAVWTVCLALAVDATAQSAPPQRQALAVEPHRRRRVDATAQSAPPQRVAVYTSTNPTDLDPANATKVLTTEVLVVSIPYRPQPLMVWYAKCVEGTPEADCEAAKDLYKQIQDTAKVLDDRFLGENGKIDAIIMKNPDGLSNGAFSMTHGSIAIYPGHQTTTVPHETAHVYVAKHVPEASEPCFFWPCSDSELKALGVNEGFAKIVAHRMTGDSGAFEPYADNVTDILGGPECVAKDLSCADEIGNLVVDAYEATIELIENRGEPNDEAVDAAFEIYRDALLELEGQTVTPAALHENVEELFLERFPPRSSGYTTVGRHHSFDLVVWVRNLAGRAGVRCPSESVPRCGR